MATIPSEIEKKYDIYVKEHPGKLIQDLNSARKERRLCDCLIKVGSEEIPAHRIILSEGCDYYRGMFTHEMRESQSGVVEMKGVDPECMVICIEYIYTGKIAVRESKIHPLLQIAQMLQLTGLFDALVAFLVQHLDAESFFMTRDLANNFGLTELQKKCEQYGEQNFEAISQQEGFQHIDKRSIISLVTSEGNKTPEGIKLKSIFDWIKYEPKERKKTLRELHKYIDLPKVPVEYRRNLIEDEPLVHSCSELMRRISISVMDTANIQSCDVGAVGGTAVLQCYGASWNVKPLISDIACMQSYDAWETRKMVHCQVVQDEVFGRLSDWELWELKEVAIANKVKFVDKSNRYLNQLAVEGFMQDVMKAHRAVKDIVKEFCEAETAASFVTWQKLVRGAWEDFHPRSAYILEKAYKARNGNSRDPKLNKIKVPEYRNHQLYQTIVDLTKLEDRYGPNPPNVRRRVKEKGSDEVIPSFWAPMQNQPFLKVALNFGSSEYQTACSYYRKMGGGGTIIKIERIQNVALYKQFIAQKAAVAKKMQSKNPVERQLFYGTDDEIIVVNGFERSYAGKNATIHGVGVYFALQASYAIGHARPNSQGHRRMFLADVITGDYCQGHRAYKAAPPKPSGIANDVYDSVVNNMSAPGVWVIFKNANAYPKFLITFA